MHVDPAAGEKLPKGHAVHDVDDVEPASENVPASHLLHDVDPVEEE